MNELPKTYNPAEHEAALYEKWEKSGGFAPSDAKETFTIVMPPPNVTGTLHLGHAVMLALEDILVRYHRMKGEATLWLPGLDHAAIATQNVVERKLKKENLPGRRTRHELGRDAFLREVEIFVEASKIRITEQIRRLGASCDWSRLAYTLDEPRSGAVQHMFMAMYEAGLLYRGDRIVHWCPRCHSTLADDEVEYEERKTKFYYFRYGPVVIGTARPETKFADKVIVVHPDDHRYQQLIGTEFDVDWIEGTVRARVIADPAVDPTFGTGAMTITPAHSFEDYELAQKYDVPVTLIIDEDGRLTQAAGSFTGQKARDARDEIVARLAEKGLVERIDDNYLHNLSVCYRCGTPVEPLPKRQWFMAVNKPYRDGKSLKDFAKEAVTAGTIHILPDYQAKNYLHWMANLRDWCVSRQIWFGHRLPVWYKRAEEGKQKTDDREEIHVGLEAPASDGWVQDEDTLDTWFSSGMWTFSTLGWPKKTKDLARFHPTSVLETGYDILFFWIARMVLMTEFALHEIPFRTVYLHGLVRDMHGKKMSKSLGNAIDPLDMVEKYGADAVRLALFIGTAAGTDMRLNEAKIAGYRNFANKVWNAARFVRLRLLDAPFTGLEEQPPESVQLTAVDEEILAELAVIARTTAAKIEAFDFNHAGEDLYHYFWHRFADQILEEQKARLANPEERAAAQFVLLKILTTCLKLLHPFMPFVTEAIWQYLPAAKEEPMLMTAQWPTSQKSKVRSQKSE